MKVIFVSKNNLNVEEYTGVTNIARSSTSVTVTYGTGSTVTKPIASWNLFVIET